MSKATPDFIEVYQFNEVTKFPSNVHWSYEDARLAVSEGQAKWVHRRKIVLAKPQRFSPRGCAFGLSAVPDAELTERHLLAVNSDRDPQAIVAVGAWIEPVDQKSKAVA